MLKQLIKRNFDEYIQDTVTNRDSYKPNHRDFELWIEYQMTHTNATYEDYKKFKLEELKRKGVQV